ncbi:Lipopolysaccharide-induced tumor necrosis factor-alpha factor like [Schistosoma japonicum]|nr:Lipopolysaccharide-induced tumor necrosis factor-alpha factor like [Schistosoma japonicum]
MTSLVVQQPVTMVSVTYFGPHPVPLSCNICMNKITTIIHYRKGVCTWMACTGIALIGGIFGCCLIPFYVDSCKDVYHSCPECGTLLGVYKRI